VRRGWQVGHRAAGVGEREDQRDQPCGRHDFADKVTGAHPGERRDLLGTLIDAR
jgi:hypothetical protein